MRTLRQVCVRSAACGIASLAVLPALSTAQSADGSRAAGDTAAQAEESPKEDARGIEEVIVTAEKRESNLQRVPISITAFTAEDLQGGGVEDSWGLQLRTPSLSISSNGPAGHLYIRGIGSDQLGVGTEGSTSIYLDDVYMGRTQNALSTLLDVQQIEVLRGPQGTLYGRNSVGGAIKIRSALPTRDYQAHGALEIGDYDKRRFEAVVSGPIVNDRLLFRFAGLTSQRDGFVKNINPNARGALQDEDVVRLRASTRYLPSDRLTLDVSADYYHDKSTGPVSKVLTPGTGAGLGAVFIPDPYTVNFDVQNTRDLENWGVTSNIVQDLGSMSFRSVTGYRENEWFQDLDSDGTEIAQQQVVWGEKQKQFSQELQLSSNGDTRLDWLVGLYYFWEHADFDVSLLRPLDAGLFNITLPSSNKTNAYAAFAQGTYHLNDALRVTAGIRYSDEKKDHVVETFINDGISLGRSPGKKSWAAVTPKVGLEYQATPRALLYVSATRGFKSGGFNSVGGGESFDPEHLWSYEGGLKTQWLNNLLQVNGGIFYYSYDDMQVTRWTQNLTAVENAAKAHVTGGEIEIVALPFKGLDISIGASVLDAKYDKYITANPANIGEPPRDLKGNTLRNAPEATLSTVAQYTHPVGQQGALTWRVEYQWQGKTYFDPFNQPIVQQDPFSVVNARLTYAAAGDRFSVSAYGKNLFDEEYFTAVFRFDSTGFNHLANVGDPRTYGLRVDVRF